MMKHWKKLLAIGLLMAASAANAIVPTICTGKMFNPITDTDWNNIFPITIMGVPLTFNGNRPTPLMQAMPPICVCPSSFGIPLPGIGITYWQPLYISEIERRPGCLSSLGGINILPGYSMLASEQTLNGDSKGKSANRMQVHWFSYPLFGMLDMMKSIGCKAPSGFSLAYVTEIDPLWQDDLWSAIFAPEAALVANPVATLACAVDGVAASLDLPIDAMFWCTGASANLYPLSGNSSHSGDPFIMNNQLQSKFIARMHRMGLAWQTVGPTAICTSHPNPVWVKSQYRYNQVGPIVRRGRPVPPGSNGQFFQFPPITNVPTQEHTINLIWQGQQCCLRF
jgi:conjugal transfer pilus assembly protein TraU